MQQPTEPNNEPEFVCGCQQLFRDVCADLSFYKEHEGKRYCLLHYPATDKAHDFEVVLWKRLDDRNFDFRGVFFPGDSNFVGFVFQRSAFFEEATFSGKAFFSGAVFVEGANFQYATFSEGASFVDAIFSKEAYFRNATFGGETRFDVAFFYGNVSFDGATFSGKADWRYLSFRTLSFRDCVFEGAVVLHNLNPERGNRVSPLHDMTEGSNQDSDESLATQGSAGEETKTLSLRFCRFEKPDVVTFHSATLSPSWFVDVDDARLFRFQNIRWLDLNVRGNPEKELQSLEDDYVASPHVHLARACRNLAVNAEESHDYLNASTFRYWAMNFVRIGRKRGWRFWKRIWWKGLVTAMLDRCYHFASGYGESVGRAFVVLTALLLLFAGLYLIADFTPSSSSPESSSQRIQSRSHDAIKLDFPQATLYSIQVVTFQKPDPKPKSGCANWLVNAETILGPIQIALLALAIRRRFMR